MSAQVLVYRTPWGDWAWKHLAWPFDGAHGYTSHAQALDAWQHWVCRRVCLVYWEAES